ncbi:MAG: beta-lactamase family protein [Syntrophales bacterium]|jgi:CubicO group peptidase (beta-lactamase class C family)|nr:beta-lactamase family protein [Syntrophales bacterium]MCK9527975.1 beta-lactamase family protein [Syntrophales bacterium]MDX9921449.1 serine hydrolase [Syntrophales bacterium]
MTQYPTPPEQDETRWFAQLLGLDFLLWTPTVQAEGFLNWERIFATRKIAAKSPIPLPQSSEDLDIRYEYLGIEKNIDDFIRDEHLSGLLVLHDGRILLEKYALGLTPARTWQSSSVVKSLTSILFGIALRDGYIKSFDDAVTDHLPELQGSVYEGVTIRHLLTMTGGLLFNEDYEDLRSDVNKKYWEHIAFRRPGAILEDLKTLERIHAPGEYFAYNTGDVYLLSHILSRAVNMTPADYCTQRLWGPMGMELDGFFTLDADDGHEVTGSCAGFSLRDYGRLGLLMQRDGIALNGERLLPEGFVKEATTPISPNFEFPLWADPDHQFEGYGYLWWVIRQNSFTALGVYGQWIHVEPESNLVVVMIGAVPRPGYMDPDEPVAQAEGNQHGSPARLFFVDAVKKLIGTQ